MYQPMFDRQDHERSEPSVATWHDPRQGSREMVSQHHGNGMSKGHGKSSMDSVASSFSSSDANMSINNHGRPVMSSKRAAQNRAAQKAFRQRREQYVKDLEQKVKSMDQWEAEMEALRSENAALKRRLQNLERQASSRASPDPSKGSNALPPQSSSISIRSLTEGVPISTPPTTPHPPSLQQKQQPYVKPPSSPSPVSTSSSSSLSPSSTGYAMPPLSHPSHGDWHDIAGMDSHLGLDPFEDCSTTPTAATTTTTITNGCAVAPHSRGQVLDDLFAMLQTRHRPQVPMVPLQPGLMGSKDP